VDCGGAASILNAAATATRADHKSPFKLNWTWPGNKQHAALKSREVFGKSEKKSRNSQLTPDQSTRRKKKARHVMLR